MMMDLGLGVGLLNADVESNDELPEQGRPFMSRSPSESGVLWLFT